MFARVFAGKMVLGLVRDVLLVICSLKCMFLDFCFGLRIFVFYS